MHDAHALPAALPQLPDDLFKPGHDLTDLLNFLRDTERSSLDAERAWRTTLQKRLQDRIADTTTPFQPDAVRGCLSLLPYLTDTTHDDSDSDATTYTPLLQRLLARTDIDWDAVHPLGRLSFLYDASEDIPVDPRELSEALMEKLGEGSKELAWTLVVEHAIYRAFPSDPDVVKRRKEERAFIAMGFFTKDGEDLPQTEATYNQLRRELDPECLRQLQQLAIKHPLKPDEPGRIERDDARALYAVGLAICNLTSEPLVADGQSPAEHMARLQRSSCVLRRVLHNVKAPLPYNFARLWMRRHDIQIEQHIPSGGSSFAELAWNALERVCYVEDEQVFCDPWLLKNSRLVSPLTVCTYAFKRQNNSLLLGWKSLAIREVTDHWLLRTRRRQQRFVLHCAGLRRRALYTTPGLVLLNLLAWGTSAALLLILLQTAPFQLAIVIALAALPTVFALCQTINLVHGCMGAQHWLHHHCLYQTYLPPAGRAPQAGEASARLDALKFADPPDEAVGQGEEAQAPASPAVGSSSFAAKQPAGTPAAAAGTDDAEAGTGDAAQEDATPSSTLPSAGQ